MDQEESVSIVLEGIVKERDDRGMYICLSQTDLSDRASLSSCTMALPYPPYVGKLFYNGNSIANK
jgi:hypothetical protein